MSAGLFRADVLSFRPVPENKFLAQPASTSRFCTKTQPPQRKKHKKILLHGCCPLLLALGSAAFRATAGKEGGVRGGEARGGSDEGSVATGEERNTVLTYFIYLVKHCLLSLPPRPLDTPPSRRRGPRWMLFYAFALTAR